MDINNNNQPNNTNQEEEKKKKKGLVAWWLGLGKWAKVGICAAGAVALASAITFPILGSTIWNKHSEPEQKQELKSISMKWPYIQLYGWSEPCYNYFITDPTDIDLTNAEIKLTYDSYGGEFVNTVDKAAKAIVCVVTAQEETNHTSVCQVDVTLNGKTLTTSFEVYNGE